MSETEKYNAWLHCPAMTDELLSQLYSMDQEMLYDSFHRNLSFGTGGLRGLIGAGTNRMNLFTVMKATRGLGTYLLEKYNNPVCAISYDSRIHSYDFAQLSAAVLADMNIIVRLFPCLQPTPVLSFAVRYLEASAGIMITASHNPASYNGYKVYGSDGCQLTPGETARIQEKIDLQPDLADSLPSFSHFLNNGMIRYISEKTVEAYYHAVCSLRIKPSAQTLHVVYTPLNGTGNIPVREVLRRLGNIRVDIVEEQELPDGCFPSCPIPNPENPEAMELAIRKTILTGADLCFATDPDCDRMSAGIRIGDSVKLISGNDMGILMLDYLCRSTDRHNILSPVVIKTIVSTDMADTLCQKNGLEIRNVLTGFKYIGEQIGLLELAGQENRFLFGFEESCGYLSATFVRDKDGVNAALLLCELAADLKSRGMNLLDRLMELRTEYGWYMQRLLTFEYKGNTGSNRMMEIMNRLRAPMSSFDADLQHAQRTDYLNDNTGLPKSNVISFTLPDSDRIVIRPSGTEPILKAYLFSHSETESSAVSRLDQMQFLVDRICK